MNGSDRRLRIASAFGAAGEWMHYPAAAWIAYRTGDLSLVAVYLALVILPGVVIREGRGRAGVVAGAGTALIAATGGSSPAALLTGGLLVGVGHALSGRGSGFAAGVHGGPGLGGVIGSIAAVAGIAAWGPAGTLASATVLLVAAPLMGARYEVRGAPPVPVLPAAFGAACATGVRLFEPVLGQSPEGLAVFAAAWTLGSHAGWRPARRADPRAILAAPFAGAAVMVILGVAQGPALPFLYAAAGAAVGLVAGTERAAGGFGWGGRRGLLTAGIAAGSAWAIWQSGDTVATASGAAAALLVGGFGSRLLSIRAPAPVSGDQRHAREPERAELRPPFPEPAPLSAREAPGPQPASEEELIEAIQRLRTALERAQVIRERALERLARSPKEFYQFDRGDIVGFRHRLLEEIDSILAISEAAARRLRSWAA